MIENCCGCLNVRDGSIALVMADVMMLILCAASMITFILSGNPFMSMIITMSMLFVVFCFSAATVILILTGLVKDHVQVLLVAVIVQVLLDIMVSILAIFSIFINVMWLTLMMTPLIGFMLYLTIILYAYRASVIEEDDADISEYSH